MQYRFHFIQSLPIVDWGHEWSEDIRLRLRCNAPRKTNYTAVSQELVFYELNHVFNLM